MTKMLHAYKMAFSILKSDKIIFLLSLSPVLIGLILYYFLGSWLYTDVLNWIKAWIETKISFSAATSAFKWLIIGILSIGLYFIVSWTFVLFISILAGPFNDLISSRTEKILKKEELDSLSEGLSATMKKFFSTILNEIKKVLFIILLSILSFLLSFIPFLAPLSISLSSLLLAISFVDYSWSRHDLPFKDCLKDLKSSLIPYGLSGFGFLMLIAVPIVNLFILPYAVIYYTILHTEKNSVKIA